MAKTEIVVSFGETRRRARHGFELRDGAVEVANPFEHGSQTMPGLDEIRSQTYRLLIGDECFARMSGSFQRQSEMESRRREIGVKLDGAAKGRQRLLEIAQFSQRYADAVADDRVSRIESRSLSELRERAIELRPIEKRESTLLVGALLLDRRSRLLHRRRRREGGDQDRETKTRDRRVQIHGVPAGAGVEPSRTMRMTTCRSSRSGSSPRFSAFSVFTRARSSAARARSPFRR